MKKGATPELSQKWWSNNKPKTLKSTGLGKALKDYEIAADRMDYDKTLTSLSSVKKKVAEALKACNSTLHKETIAGLKKYTGVIEKEIKRQKDLKSEFAKNAGKAAGPKKQRMGKSVTIWERDISALVLKKGLPDWVDNFKNYTMKLTLNEDILDALEEEDDLVTPAYMAEDAEKLGQKLVIDIYNMGKNLDSASQGRSPQDRDKIRARFSPEVTKLFNATAKQMQGIPAARWKKFVSDKREYRDYKIKAGLDMSIGVLNTTVSALGIVGTGGAGLVLGIVGLVRSIADLVKQCYNLWIEAETVEKSLSSDLDTLRSRYQTVQGKAKKMQGGAEVGHTVIKSLIGVDTPFMATLPKCNSNYDLWLNKVRGLGVAGRKLSATIVKALADCATLERKIAKAADKKARKIFDKIKDLRGTLDDALKDCSAMMARVSSAEGNMKSLKRLLDGLNATNPKYADIFEKVAPRVTGVVLGAASGGVGINGAETTLETVAASVVLAKDLMLEGKAGLETVLG